MSQKNAPKFDKEIELAKINLVAEEWRANVLMLLGTVLSALVGIAVVISAANFANQISFEAAVVVLLFEVAFFSSYGVIFLIRPYQKRLPYLDSLFKKVYDGEPIGNVADLLKKK